MPHSEGVLTDLPLLASLPADQRGLVVECFESRTYEFGATVVTQGEPADAYYVITSGRARVLKTGADGGEVPLNLLSAGEAFGELALIEQSPRSATVRASTTLEVLRLDRSVFVALVRLHPELARSMGADVAAVRRGDFLRLHPVFAGLPRPLVTAAVRAMEELRLAPGERFAAPADDRQGLVLVASGRLAVVDADGAEELPLHAGDVVRLGVRNSSIEARTDASLLRLRGVDRDRLSADHPEVDTRLDERADLVERRRSGDTEVARQGVRTTPTDEALLAEIAEDDPGSTGRVPGAPQRRRWRRYASVRQIDSMDCGAACVATLCRHFGHDVSLPAIRAAVGTGLDGTSLRGIMDGGAELGLEFRTIKSSIDRLPDLPAPLVLHWGGNHWVVLHELRGDKAVLADPATGLRTVSTSQLEEEWSGYAAIPTPTPRLADAPRAGLTLGWLRPLVRPYRGALVLAAMLAFVATALQVALPVLTEVVVDGLLDGDGAARATRTVGWIVLALLGAVGATLVQQRIFARVAVEVDGLALDYIAERMLRLPVGYFQVRRTADIQRRLEGMREVRRVLVEQGVAAATAVFQLLVALVVLFFFSPVLALMFVLVFPAYALLMRYSSSRLKPVFDTLEEAFGRYQGKQLDAIRGIEVVKVSGAEAGFRRTLLREFEGLQDRLYRRDLTLLTYEGLVSLVTLGVVTLFLWVGALLVTAGSMSVGARFPNRCRSSRSAVPGPPPCRRRSLPCASPSGKVDLAATHQPDQRCRQRAAQLDLNPRKRLAEAVEDRGQDERGVEVGCAEHDVALDVRGRKPRQQLVMEAKDRLGVGQHHVAVVGQDLPPSLMPEERLVGQFLELLDLEGDGGLRPSQLPCGLGHAPGLHDRDEGPEHPDVDADQRHLTVNAPSLPIAATDWPSRHLRTKHAIEDRAVTQESASLRWASGFAFRGIAAARLWRRDRW